MSDGMSDAAALGRLSETLEKAAHDFSEAITAAVEGHRGWGINVEDTVNPYLKEAGFELVRVKR